MFTVHWQEDYIASLILLTVYFSKMNQFNYLENKITLSSQYFDVSNRFRSVSPNCFCTDMNYCFTRIFKRHVVTIIFTLYNTQENLSFVQNISEVEQQFNLLNTKKCVVFLGGRRNYGIPPNCK